MAGIWSINNAYNINLKKITNKLSFQLGEIFLARVMNLEENSDEVLLRLLDGWQFSAKLKKPLDFQPLGLIRFKVEGFEDGKLELIIVDNKNPEERLKENSIENALRRENISVDKKDYPLLEKMIKHNMPLTKQNISYVRNLMELFNNVCRDKESQENFINKYMESRGININSNEGKITEGALRGCFEELKNINEDDILTLLENNIDLNEDNIKSFKKIFKDSSMYESLKEIKHKVKEGLQGNEINEKITLENGSYQNENSEVSINQNMNKKETVIEDKKSVVMVENKENDINNSQEKGKVELDKTLKQSDIDKENNIIHKDLQKDTKNVLDNNIKNNNENLKIDELKFNKNKIVKEDLSSLSNTVKEQINNKLEDMKNSIKNLIEIQKGVKPENYDKLINMLKQDMNDFKVFNTLSNQYYYMDLPINVDKDEYECKLIIKDDRKKGKIIDSKNVKIATSVKTINMGVVDAFISVNNNIMNIDIKSSREWITVLSSKKDKVLNELHDTGYNIYVNISEKVEDFNLTNCNKFFEDNNMNAIDIKA